MKNILEKLNYDYIIEFLKEDKTHKFCLCDYRNGGSENYEIIYKNVNNTIMRKRWDTNNWTLTKFRPVSKTQLEKDIEKAISFQTSKDYNLYTKLVKDNRGIN